MLTVLIRKRPCLEKVFRKEEPLIFSILSRTLSPSFLTFLYLKQQRTVWGYKCFDGKSFSYKVRVDEPQSNGHGPCARISKIITIVASL